MDQGDPDSTAVLGETNLEYDSFDLDQLFGHENNNLSNQTFSQENDALENKTKTCLLPCSTYQNASIDNNVSSSADVLPATRSGRERKRPRHLADYSI